MRDVFLVNSPFLKKISFICFLITYREANQLSFEMKKDSEFAVTLQVKKIYLLVFVKGNNKYTCCFTLGFYCYLILVCV